MLGYGRGGKPGGRTEERSRSWNRSSVGSVERGTREVTVDELIGLAIVLAATPFELLDCGGANLALREGGMPLRPPYARPFAHVL